MKLIVVMLSTVFGREIGPSENLDALLNSALDILSSGAYDDFHGPGFISRWQNQLTINTERLKRNLNNLCADNDAEFLPITNLEIENPCAAMGQVLDGFLSWTNTYLGQCDRQMNLGHQRRRHEKWTDLLVREACSGTTTRPPTTTTIETTTSVTLYYHYTLTQNVAAEAGRIGNGMGDFYRRYTPGYEVKVSTVCNPNFSSDWEPSYTCEYISSNGHCDVPVPEESWILYGSFSGNGFETWLLCPQCGCVNNQPNMWNVADSSGRSIGMMNIFD